MIINIPEQHLPAIHDDAQVITNSVTNYDAWQALLTALKTAIHDTPPTTPVDALEGAGQAIGSSPRATAEQRFDLAVVRVHGLPPEVLQVALDGVNAAYDLGRERGRDRRTETLAELEQARRFAGELHRLVAGLDDLGIIPAPGLPDHEAAVTTALTELELTQRRTGKAFERGPLPEAIYEASVARYDEALNATIGDPEHLETHPAYRAGVEGAVDTALGLAADGLRMLVQADRDVTAARARRDELSRRIEELQAYADCMRGERGQFAHDLDVARDELARAKAAAALYDEAMALYDEAMADRDQARADVTRLKTRLVDDTARLRAILAKVREERDQARELVDTLTARQPDREEYGAAEKALIAAWLVGGDRVYVAQIARVALDAAWAVNHPRRRDVAASHGLVEGLPGEARAYNWRVDVTLPPATTAGDSPAHPHHPIRETIEQARENDPCDPCQAAGEHDCPHEDSA